MPRVRPLIPAGMRGGVVLVVAAIKVCIKVVFPAFFRPHTNKVVRVAGPESSRRAFGRRATASSEVRELCYGSLMSRVSEEAANKLAVCLRFLMLSTLRVNRGRG